MQDNIFFSHTFPSHNQLFFKGEYFTQIEGALDQCTNMDIVKAKSGRTCILPIWKLLHKFFQHPIVVQDNDEKTMVIFELQDLVLRTHLLVPRKPGCCPPWPVEGDIAIISLPSSTSDASLYLAYVVQVYYMEMIVH